MPQPSGSAVLARLNQHWYHSRAQAVAELFLCFFSRFGLPGVGRGGDSWPGVAPGVFLSVWCPRQWVQGSWGLWVVTFVLPSNRCTCCRRPCFPGNICLLREAVNELLVLLCLCLWLSFTYQTICALTPEFLAADAWLLAGVTPPHLPTGPACSQDVLVSSRPNSRLAHMFQHCQPLPFHWKGTKMAFYK